MKPLELVVVQPNIVWENPDANRNALAELLAPVHQADVILLPEMWATGFTMNPQRNAESMHGKSVRWMQELAAKCMALVAGSLVIEVEKNSYRNRMVMCFPNGDISCYDKRHLFSLSDEPKNYQQGHEQVSVKWHDWRIKPLICYDLRFPVWSRNTTRDHLMLYAANWPDVRIQAWNALLPARAIENQCYVAASNRVGIDGVGMEHQGHSQIIDFKGNTISKKEGTAGLLMATLQPEPLEAFRSAFPVLHDADSFLLNP